MSASVKKSILILIISFPILLAILLPRKIEKWECNKYAKPLFSHSLPSDTELVYKSFVRDDEGGTTASLILNTSLSQEELSNHYSDTEIPAAREGEKVTLEVKLLDSASIEALKEAGLYKDGGCYYFVYIYRCEK